MGFILLLKFSMLVLTSKMNSSNILYHIFCEQFYVFCAYIWNAVHWHWFLRATKIREIIQWNKTHTPKPKPKSYSIHSALSKWDFIKLKRFGFFFVVIAYSPIRIPVLVCMMFIQIHAHFSKIQRRNIYSSEREKQKINKMNDEEAKNEMNAPREWEIGTKKKKRKIRVQRIVLCMVRLMFCFVWI